MRKCKYKGKIKKAAGGIQQVKPDYSSIHNDKGEQNSDQMANAVGGAIPAAAPFIALGNGLHDAFNKPGADGMIDADKAGWTGWTAPHRAAGYMAENGSTKDVIGAFVNPFGANKKMAEMKNQKVLEARAVATNQTFNNSIAGIDVTKHQKGMAKKGLKNNKYKIIEIEGKATPEIHTDKNFNIKNEGTTPHEQGGNKVMAEEGDIVFNTQNSPAKYKKIKKAIATGDKNTLEKEQAKLPEDTSSKAEGGIKTIKPDYQDGTGLNSRIHDEIMALNGGKGQKKPWDPQALNSRIHDQIMNIDTSKASPSNPAPSGGGGNSAMGGLGSYANAAYNLYQGLKPADKEERNYLSSVYKTYSRKSQATEAAIEDGRRVSNNAARNLSGGNAGNYRSNVQANNNKAVDQMRLVDTQEAMEASRIQEGNVDLRNKTNAVNLELKNKYNDLDAQNKAGKYRYLEAASSEITRVGEIKEKEANLKDYNDRSLDILGNMYNYKFADNKEDIIFAGERTGTAFPQPAGKDITVRNKDGNTTTIEKTRYKYPGSRYTNGGRRR